MENKEIYDELSSIKAIMERSTKFISLSGLSGILAGIYALIGSVIAWLILKDNPTTMEASMISFIEVIQNSINILVELTIVALAVLSASIITGCVLSFKKAKSNGQPVWNKTSKLLLYNMLVPLLTGGIAVIILLYQGNVGYIAPAMLIFYGLSLFNAGNFTFAEIKYLGIIEIILGLTAALLPEYGLWAWALGFGVMHIIYGTMMYLKYDRENRPA